MSTNPEEVSRQPIGFAEPLEVLADRDHEEHERMLTWVRGAYDPEVFDLAAVNESLSFIAACELR